MRAGALLFFLGLASLDTTAAFAQAKWFEVEPKFPPTCIVLRAGLKFQLSVQSALQNCPPNYAVELAPGPNRLDNSFVINPITLPPKVSLIVDGGVTVYGTTDASRYQVPSAPGTCGTVGPYPVYGICKPLISFTSGSGIYGYGIIDGQGQMPVRVKGKTIESWWHLLTDRKLCPSKSDGNKACQEASPLMISAGNTDGSSTNLVLYKITLRNPPFHTTRLSGSHVTAWGVKVQAPWNVPNTDGFDVHGNDILIKDSIVANGDQDIAFTSSGRITSDVMVDGLRAYGKGGVALLDDGPGFSGITIDDFAMTGDLPSVVGSTVNGVTERQMQAEHGVRYGQALPSATDGSQGMQINTGLDSTSLPPSRSITNVSFSKVCMSDIVRPIHIGPLSNPDPNNPPKDGCPLIRAINFRDVTVLPPGPQFVVVNQTGTPPYQPGKYSLTLQADPKETNGIALQNLVVGNQNTPAASLFDTIIVEGNAIAASRNVYPAFFNHMDQPSGNPAWTFENNVYSSKAASTSPQLASPCSSSQFPFVTGELYAGVGLDPTRYWANLQTAKVKASAMVKLFAVVQPIMSQTSQFMPGSYGASPGLFAIGSPPLKGKVTFFDHNNVIGTAGISGNGTLATLTIDHIDQGTHMFSAEYSDPPAAHFYNPLSFGGVSIEAAK